MVSWDSKVDNFAKSPFFGYYYKVRSSGRDWGDPCVCQSLIGVYACHFLWQVCIYHLFVWSNLHFLHISQWNTLPTLSCLLLYSFCANLLYSLIMWVIVSSLSPHILHLLFCWFFSIIALIRLVVMALSFAAIRRDSVFLLRFPFLSQIIVIIIIIIIELFSSALTNDIPQGLEWQQVSGFSRILADHYNTVVWMVFTRLLISTIVYSMRVFRICIIWWTFIWVWVTASLLKSPGHISAFWAFSLM